MIDSRALAHLTFLPAPSQRQPSKPLSFRDGRKPGEEPAFLSPVESLLASAIL